MFFEFPRTRSHSRIAKSNIVKKISRQTGSPLTTQIPRFSALTSLCKRNTLGATATFVATGDNNKGHEHHARTPFIPFLCVYRMMVIGCVYECCPTVRV